MKISFLYGANLSTLFRLFKEEKFRIQAETLPSILLHFFMGGVNSLLSLPEKFRSYETDPQKPVFIIGHWRSGTTHLHNLMTVDGSYHALNTFQAAFPHVFMKSENWLSPLMDKIGPGTRLMDNMAMHMESSQEEEIGLASLGAPSSYLAIHFPKSHERYKTYVSFREASEKELAEWKKAYQHYLRKLVAKWGNEKPLVLKSPANTARISLLLQMYPDARFIHIHRNPYETIRSTMHLYDSWFKMANFQSLSQLKRGRDGYILDTYEEMHRIWIQEKNLIEGENLFVLPFEKLKNQPLESLGKIYDFLGDSELDTAAIETYLKSIKRYKQNRYDPLGSEMIAAINRRMGFVFEEFGYKVIDEEP